ncbi:hypothetical protein BJ742DRAFT_42857 [Cladochytrium replicatum]|nr:hypothetical protein BJ742DRAFT_42857 [Cladochytrium replicatum]
MERKVAELIVETFAILVMDAFETDRRAWRVVEEATAIVWYSFNGRTARSRSIGGTDIGRVHGISTTRALFLWLLKRVAYEVKHKQPQDFTAAKKENIHHLLLLTEEFLFNHHDLRDVVQRESLSIPTGTLADYPGSLSQASLSDLESNSIVTNLDRTAPSTNRNDMVVRMSYPVDECWELSQDFSETNEKSHVRVGGLSRMLFRILLSALAVQEPTGREFATRHLAKLLKSQSKAYMQSETHPHILNVVGHIHEGYKIAVQATNHSAALPEILSLYYLTVKAWLDVLLQIKSEGNPLPVTELKQAIASVDSFAEFLKSSSRWAIIGDKALFPATKVVEDEYCRLVPLMTRRYARFIRHLIPRFNREEQNALRVMIAQQQALSHTLRRKKQEDTTRLIDRLTAMESERRSLLRAWTAVYREISQERGIWYLYDAESIFFSDMLPQEHWKLDRTENHLRMRRKLIQNYDFDDHMEASLRRDKSTMALLDSSPHMRPGKMLQEKKRSQLERIRSQMLSTKEGGSTSAEESTSILSSTTSSPKADTGKPTSLANRDSYPGGPSDDDGQDDWKFVDEDDIAVSIMGDSQDGGDKTPSTLAFSPFGLGRATGSDPQERVIFTAECDHIMLMTSVRGKLQITTQYISFIVDLRTMASEISEIEEKTVALVETEVLRDRRWPISALTEMYPRRYMLRKSALEFFFEDQTNHFFNFKTPRERARVATKVLGLKPPNLLSGDIRSPPDMLRRTTLTERWQKHEISNFEYLMHLNTISGRTYNDLTQYPVFPWVLRDYESDVLDLSNPDVYRDLSKPTGAMDEARLNQLLERYRNFEDPSGQIKKFLYGTHYSSAAATLFYLLRMEPFTSLHIALQGGKFDHPDRQFHSIHGSWISATTGNGDVKELIPEFFYLPDFLVNENGFNLGTKQTGPEVNDVVLPKWASSPEEFIRLHREALESDFVSQNLHNWIDLIWGYKQQGEEAVKANNVFYYLTYEGAIDIDSVKDPVERRSIEDQINNFGQTPSQLFKKPHPMRFPKKDWVKPSLFTSPHQHKSYLIQLKSGGIPFVSLCGFESSGWAWGNTGSGVSLSGLSSGAPSSGLSLVSSVVPEKLISIGYDLLVGSHRWSVSAYPTDVPFTFDPDVAPPAKRRLHSHLSGHIRPHSRLFATTRDGRHIISGGHWDGCFRITPIDAIGSLALTRSSSSAGGGSNSSGSTGYAADAVYGHQDIVTALALSEDGRVLVTGSKDTTVMSWELTSGELCGIKPGSQKVFFGHDDEVATVAVNIEHDLVVSGSKDGTCIIHTFYDARYVKTLRPTSNFQDDNLSAQMIVITKQGYIVVYLERTDAESLQKSTAEATAASGRATSGTSADDDDDDDDARMDAGKDDELARRRQTLRRVSSVATPNQYRGQRRGSVTGLSTPTSGEGSPHTSGPGTPSHSLLLAASLDANASFLHLYSINGKLLKDRLFSWRLNDLRASSDGYHLVAADDRGGICLLRAHSLQISHRFDVSVSVLSVALSHKSQFLFLGRTDGKLLMIAIDPKATLEDDAKSAKQLKDKELVEGESQ